jgi:hypothetical protein
MDESEGLVKSLYSQPGAVALEWSGSREQFQAPKLVTKRVISNVSRRSRFDPEIERGIAAAACNEPIRWG